MPHALLKTTNVYIYFWKKVENQSDDVSAADGQFKKKTKKLENYKTPLVLFKI